MVPCVSLPRSMTAHRRRTSLLVIAALGAGCDSRPPRTPNDTVARAAAAPTRPAANSRCTGQVVCADGVGPIRLGMSLDSLQRVSTIVHDTTVPNPHGPAERHLSVLLGGDTALITVGGGRVGEILLTGGTFRTADSIGIGTPLRVLLARDSVKGYGVAGQLLVSMPSECGFAFGIAGHYPDLPDGRKEITTLAAVPQTAVVDRIRIDGCERDEDAPFSGADDSTYDVQTDTVLLAKDLDGNGVTDYVVRENRPFHHSRMYIPRLAVYLDSIPRNRRPRWSSGWDLEGETTLGAVLPLGAHAAMVEMDGNTGDYTSETLLAIRNDSVIQELTHGEDYGQGFLQMTKKGDTLVVDASQWHLLLRGTSVGPDLECKDGEWPAVRLRWDDATQRFAREKPRCVKSRD